MVSLAWFSTIKLEHLFHPGCCCVAIYNHLHLKILSMHSWLYIYFYMHIYSVLSFNATELQTLINTRSRSKKDRYKCYRCDTSIEFDLKAWRYSWSHSYLGAVNYKCGMDGRSYWRLATGGKSGRTTCETL